MKYEDDAKNKYGDEDQKRVDDYFRATVDRRFICELPHQTRRFRESWQNRELATFINSVLGVEPRILANDPIKIPSGKYVETLKVERTQQDLNNEMVGELTNLPRFHAYVKIGQVYKMKTRELPDIQNPNMVEQAIENGYTLGKTREAITEEIRKRQGRWGRGGSAPGTRGNR